MFDFHLHLSRLPHSADVAKALLQADCGFNNVACEPWEWEKSMELMKITDVQHAQSATKWTQAFGVHPMAAAQVSESEMNRLEQILRSGDYAVGECGLDKRFEGYESAGVQELIFKRQVKWAQELNRPIQVHCVGDYSRILKMIADVECCQRETAPVPQVIFHRFGGDAGIIKATLQQLGTRALFSLHADSFRKKSTAAAMGLIPREQVRFETDADESFSPNDANTPNSADVPPRNGTDTPKGESASDCSTSAAVASRIQECLERIHGLFSQVY